MQTQLDIVRQEANFLQLLYQKYGRFAVRTAGMAIAGSKTERLEVVEVRVYHNTHTLTYHQLHACIIVAPHAS